MASSGLVLNPADVESFSSSFHLRPFLGSPSSQSPSEAIQIYLATVGRHKTVMPLRVLNSDTIHSVKMRIQAHRGFFTTSQRLVYGGKELIRDDCLIKDYGVCSGEVVHLVLRLCDLVDVKVKTITGKEYDFKVRRNDRVRDLKLRIKDEGGLALNQQQLVFNGKPLEDHKRIEDLHSEEDVVIHLVVRRTAKVRSKSVGADVELSVTAADLELVIDKFSPLRVNEPSVISKIDSKTRLLSPPTHGVEAVQPKERVLDGVGSDYFILEPALDYCRSETPDSLFDVLRSARAGLQGGIAPVLTSEGSGGTYFMKDEKSCTVGVFKPSDEEPKAVNNPRGLPRSNSLEGLKSGTRVGEGAMREVAAYILDHPASGLRSSESPNLQGFAGVPPTMMVRSSHRGFNYSSDGVKTKIGSLQQFVKSVSNCEDMGPAKFPVDEVHKISVLDMRLANTDRNGGNILVCKDEKTSAFKLVPIDHGYCMPDKFEDCTFEWLYWPQARVPFGKSTLEYIAKLDADWDISILAAHGFILRPECARVLRVATALLKKGAAAGLSPFEVGSMMSRENFDVKSAIEIMLEEAERDVSSQASENEFMDHLSDIMDNFLAENFPKLM